VEKGSDPVMSRTDMTDRSFQALLGREVTEGTDSTLTRHKIVAMDTAAQDRTGVRPRDVRLRQGRDGRV